MVLESLSQILLTRAQEAPDQTAFTFLADGEREEQSITCRDLDAGARAVAASLQAAGGKGERALLLFPSGLEFIQAFFGCLYAGVVAVPAALPRQNRRLDRLAAIARDASASLALAAAADLGLLRERISKRGDLRRLRWIPVGPGQGDASLWMRDMVGGESIAYLQYTSGSTGTPRGVMISHGNVLANSASIHRGFSHTSRSIGLTWLPNFHDMGLVDGIIQPLFGGFTAVLMRPLSFLQRPARWLQAITRFSATHSGGPNFAYDLCAEKVTEEEKRRLDLTSWEVAYNGAEPVSSSTLARFTRAFADCGFRASSHTPSYGLAEATLKVTSGGRGSPPGLLSVEKAGLQQGHALEVPEGGRSVVSCGRPEGTTRVLIVDSRSRKPCRPGRVGEIWVRGPGVARGYWRRPAETQEIFRAFLDGGQQGPFLRTGDLGFMKKGELFVTGRLKDLIIIRGQNHYPQDIEATVGRCHPALQPSRCAAFTVRVDGGESESLVVVQEVRRRHLKDDPAPVGRSVRRAVSQAHGLDLYTVVLLRPAGLPRGSSGKVQRRLCRELFLRDALKVHWVWRRPVPAPAAAGPQEISPAAANPVDPDDLRDWLRKELARRTGQPLGEIDTGRVFADHGLSSLAAVEISGELAGRWGLQLPATLLYEYPTIDALVPAVLNGSRRLRAKPAGGGKAGGPVAIIGMGCRFPGARGPAAFWDLLVKEKDAITEVPPERWDPAALAALEQADSLQIRRGGFLQEIDRFDHAFFGISPREAERMDPQQRLVLDVAWETLEEGGQPRRQLQGSATGVFLGVSNQEYRALQFSDPALLDAFAATGNSASIIANRLSYFFGWHGPSVVVDTACSSSLVAIHQAIASLARGESHLALAGGVNLILSPAGAITFSRAGVMARDGRCKAFDARADGFVRGEGVGMVLLKPLDRALADGDRIHAVLRGSAVNHDGRTNGLMAPSGKAQEAVLRAAYRDAGVDPAQVDYVEAHGTGTQHGDPIEAGALAAVLGQRRPPGRPLAIGSVKTNIGHLEAAAGVAGLMKVVLSLERGTLPASLHFRQPNPLISLDLWHLDVVSRTVPWPASLRPALAGVSSFGFGGTNAHLVVEAPPARQARPETSGGSAPSLLVLSAHTPGALRERAAAVRRQLAGVDPPSFPALCHAAAVHLSHLEHRLALLALDGSRAVKILEDFLAGRSDPGLFTGRAREGEQGKLVFVLSGQGSQWPGMGAGLMDREPVFRQAVMECHRLMAKEGYDTLVDDLTGRTHAARLASSHRIQATLFAMQIGLARLWESVGIRPDALVGHSMGDVAAAHLAAALSLDDAVRIICRRGRLMRRVSGQGRMLAVDLPAAEAARLLEGCHQKVVLAVSNSPAASVLGGDPDALTEMIPLLEARGVGWRQVAMDVAAHTPQMDPLREELLEALSPIRSRPAKLPLYSGVIGGRLGAGALDAAHWWRGMREPVRFSEAFRCLVEDGHDIFLEVSPHPILLPAMEEGLHYLGRRGLVLGSLRRRVDPVSAYLKTLAALHMRGRPVDWRRLHPSGHPDLSLPLYPWQGERHWLSIGTSSTTLALPAPGAASHRPSSLPQEEREDLLYQVAWEEGGPVPARPLRPQAGSGAWLILADRAGVGPAVSSWARRRGHRVIEVEAGGQFRQTGEDRYQVRPDHPGDLSRLLAAAGASLEGAPGVILHLWSLDMNGAAAGEGDEDGTLRLGVGSAMALARALPPRAAGVQPRLFWVTRGAQAVRPEEAADFRQAALWGLGRAHAWEQPALWGGLADLGTDLSPRDAASHLGPWAEGTGAGDQVAFRGNSVHRPRLQRFPRAGAPAAGVSLRSGATYLISGGLGGLGKAAARRLIRRGARHLLLLGRVSLPPREAWGSLAGEDGPLALKVADLRELEAEGASVRYAAVDVADERALAAVLERHRQEGRPPFRGVIHAAGAAQPGRLLEETDPSVLRKILPGKVEGAWHLHRLLKDEDLDFFVMFSSAASTLGFLGQGQAVYAAANAALDALSCLRRSEGRPASSIGWGPWAEAGLAVRQARLDRLAGAGVEGLSTVAALAALEGLMTAEIPVSLAVSLDWNRLPAFFTGVASSPFFQKLVPKEGGQGTDRPGSRLRLISDPDLCLQGLSDHLRRRLAEVLGLARDDLDPGVSLSSLGLDSLVAVEIRKRLEKDLGVSLPLQDLFRGGSIDQLARKMWDLLRQDPLDPPPDLPSHEAAPAGMIPLSSSQSTLWFTERMHPGSAGYNVPLLIRLRRAPDAGALARSFQVLVDRHASLRTIYRQEGEHSGQIIQPHVPVRMVRVDASRWDRSEMDQRLAAELQRPFRLEEGPLFRITLFSMGPSEAVLLVVIHHIAIDFRSMEILLDDLRVLYPALAEGRRADLPPLSHSYTDFVRWQERRLLSAAAEMDRTYWRRVLSGDLPVLDLPLGRGRPETPSYKGVSEVMALEKDQLAALREMAARRGTTLYTVLLSAFMVWLHRYTGDRDLVVGSPTLGRTRPEFRPVVGFFANPLPLRADFEGDPPFKDFLARVHGVVCGALEHQDLPLEEIIRIVRPPRDRGRTPLFQVLFGWDRPESGRRPAPASSAWLDPHAVLQETFKVEYRVALLDLGAIAVESGDQVSLHFQFSSDLFDAETRSRMLGHFRTLLAAIPSQEDRPLSRISFMDREERVRALSMGHPERKAEHEENEEDETPVPVRFEAQVERTPDGVAVISERGRLTYRQLNEWANRLAHHLIQAGAGRGSLVGLCLPPSPERIASLLAILKTGAAYLPLDPSTPVVRLEQMMRTAAPPYLIICGPEASPSAPGGTQVIDLLKESEQVAACPAHNPGRRPSSRDLAYVIFTSGSTGSPKGVMVPHGAVSNLVASFMESYAPGPSDRMIQQTSISFDASVGEIFPLLCAGGGLVLPRPEELQDPGLMADLMARQKVSIMAGIPSLLARFNEMEEARRPRPRLILSGAEPLALAHVDRFVGVCRVTNAYGPTEATVCATVFDLDDLALLEEGRDGVPGGLDPRRVLPIGRPIRRTRVYVLDRHGQPVPQGVTGEIHIGGAGLALGYLNDPELTARRFIPDPTGEGDGSRLYRTGDLGRLDARGFLHFKGRADQQVKIRGFRVEMEEVRQSLLRHPQVGEAHVAARPDGASGKRLVAYLAGRDGGAAPPVREIRHWLTDRLPRQMVPAAFIWMERLPKSPSGKVAAGALPEPDGAEAAPAPASRAPVTPLQKSLARIWSELLHRRDVNLTDDFFDLGGNSLMEMQLLARVQAQFQRRFPVGRFHREPTLQYLAHLVEQDDSASLPACLMEIQPGGARPPLFFVHSLTGLASEYLSLAAALGPQQPFYALQAVGRNGGGDGEATLEEMASRYIEAIRKIQPSGPYHLGGWSMGGAVAFEMSRNLEAQGEQVAFLALVDAPFPIRRSGRPLSEGLINRSVLSTLALSFGVSAGDLLALLGPGGTDPESSLDRLLAAARAGGLLPGRMERDELRRILEISRENMRCLAAYRPGKYPGRIDFFQAQSSVLQTGGGTGRLSRSMAWVFRRLAAGEPAAWKNLASGELQVHTVPGNHFTLMRPPHVRSTALVLERCLERCRRGAGEMAGETRR